VARPAPRQRKILLGDDEANVRRLVEVTLASDEYVTLHASSGTEVLEVVRREHPDLVLLDINMPGDLNGLEVCRRIKGDPANDNTAVIMLTAAVDDEQRHRALDYGAIDYITKPFSPLALLSRLDSLFEETR